MASFSGCRAIIFACRRKSARTLGSRKSGTQCCTGLRPRARSRSRRADMRCRGVRVFAFFGVLAIEKERNMLRRKNQLPRNEFHRSRANTALSPPPLSKTTDGKLFTAKCAAAEIMRTNLSIVWQPKTLNHHSRGIYKVGDWAHWPGEGTYGWWRPSNELIFIRDITRLRPGEVRCRHEPDICNWDVLDELFISLLKASYNWLCETLSSVAHVEKITD